MARPSKAPEERRESRVNPRLTTAERVLIEQNAAALGLTPSEYIRRRSLGYRMPATGPDQRQLSHAIAELNRVGVNLNQIAKHMNAGRGVPPHLAALLSRLDATLDRLLDGPGDNGNGPVL